MIINADVLHECFEIEALGLPIINIVIEWGRMHSMGV